MDKRSKILFLFLALATAASFIAIYIRTFIRQDFNLYAYVDCDPSFESCFVYECDPAWDDWCIEEPEDPRENIWPYKFFFKSAKDTPRPEDANCDPIEAQDCPLIECAAGDTDCEITCDPLTDGADVCIGPGDDFFMIQEEDAEAVDKEVVVEDITGSADESGPEHEE